MEKITLKAEGIKTSFQTSEGKVVAVNDVDLTIKEGKILGVVGESGCGKSVTALSIMRLVPQPNGKIEEGRIEFMGKNLLELSNEEMRKIRGAEISMIFQEPMTALNPVYSIGNQMNEMLKVHRGLSEKQATERSIELINMVGIPRAEKVIKEYPHQLSGGMRQRVMIAMALSCDPKFMIADEPTTALDVTIQAQVLELMKDLNEQMGTSIMFITHDLGVIAEMADDVVVMYAGKIVEEADVVTLFHDPKHPYSVGLLKSRPDMVEEDEELEAIEGMVPSLLNMPKGCPFNPRCKHCMEICKEKMPVLKEITPGHKVRCWLYDQEGGG
ncbi:ABC transporter ATP-binding protein [Isachenkonia alkalipeptolytica]|uniref:ABC transporter ATP-binding protein n=1 Tax=Isachenkonia alkalipeptolytica TaxID=2565777 RepID=A0AA44BEW4_9CLOT|nr:ABC transporter ATP-binding protein [Isachenkonia alkalipeptolytica]NBG89368.1 ABC transporter ATP-binding protein [Isachenkonia alkalipeptolytica]